MVLNVERLRGNTVFVNGRMVANGGAYRPEIPTAPSSSVVLTLDSIDIEPMSASTRASEILTSRAWAHHRAGNAAAAAACWEAAKIVTDRSDPRLAGLTPDDFGQSSLTAFSGGASEALTARAWAQHRDGNNAGASAFWGAATLLDDGPAEIDHEDAPLVRNVWA